MKQGAARLNATFARGVASFERQRSARWSEFV